MEREQANREFVVLDVHPINLGVARDRGLRARRVTIDQRFDSLRDLALDQPAHLDQAGAQTAQLFFILAIGVLCLGRVHRKYLFRT